MTLLWEDDNVITSEQWRDWIYSGIGSGLKMLWDALEPIAIPAIISFLIIVIIIKGILFVAFHWFRLSGDSNRLARRKTRKIKKVIELVSALKDICGITKH